MQLTAASFVKQVRLWTKQKVRNLLLLLLLFLVRKRGGQHKQSPRAILPGWRAGTSGIAGSRWGLLALSPPPLSLLLASRRTQRSAQMIAAQSGSCRQLQSTERERDDRKCLCWRLRRQSVPPAERHNLQEEGLLTRCGRNRHCLLRLPLCHGKSAAAAAAAAAQTSVNRCRGHLFAGRRWRTKQNETGQRLASLCVSVLHAGQL